MHEIISIDGELVTTKGSANNTPDEPIKYDYIKGEVVAVIPAVGVIVSIAKSPLVTVLLLAVAVLLLILSYRKEREEDDKELDSIKEEIRSTEKNISQILFKLAVESAMLSELQATQIRVTDEQMEQLRRMCSRIVSENNGIITFEKACKHQKG